MTARLWTAMLVLLAVSACKYVGTPNKDASASTPAPADSSYAPPPTPAPANPGCLKGPAAPLGTSPSSGSNGVTNTANSTATTTGTATGSSLDLTAPSGGAAP